MLSTSAPTPLLPKEVWQIIFQMNADDPITFCKHNLISKVCYKALKKIEPKQHLKERARLVTLIQFKLHQVWNEPEFDLNEAAQMTPIQKINILAHFFLWLQDKQPQEEIEVFNLTLSGQNLGAFDLLPFSSAIPHEALFVPYLNAIQTGLLKQVTTYRIDGLRELDAQNHADDQFYLEKNLEIASSLGLKGVFLDAYEHAGIAMDYTQVD